MRHIDLRQHWVHLLRESGLVTVTCVHVSTVSNVSAGDQLTKALDTSTLKFRRLRDQLMYWCRGPL